jgi:hypothetical protein
MARTVLVGQGVAATAALNKFGNMGFRGKTLIVGGRPNWISSFKPMWELGQSEKGLAIFDDRDIYRSPELKHARDLQKDLSLVQMDTLLREDVDDVDYVDASLSSVRRVSGGLLLGCTEGTNILAEQVILCLGVGPERTLGDSGVQILNRVGDTRAIKEEVTTALRSMDKPDMYFKNKSVIFYGDGATASWAVESALCRGIGDLSWIGKNNFISANPNGRNNHIMRATEGLRFHGAMQTLRYLGSLDDPSTDKGLRVEVLDLASGGRIVREADVIICATGANPMARLGIGSILAASDYHGLVPVVGPNGGVIACSPDARIIVASTSVVDKPEIRTLVETHSYSAVSQENRVLQGAAVAKLSGELAATIDVKRS